MNFPDGTEVVSVHVSFEDGEDYGADPDVNALNHIRFTLDNGVSYKIGNNLDSPEQLSLDLPSRLIGFGLTFGFDRSDQIFSIDIIMRYLNENG